MNERRISIRNLCYFVLKKLWIIFLAAILTGAALAGYRYYKDKKNANVSEDVKNGSALEPDEKLTVDNAILQFQYASEEEKYIATSPLMEVDWRNEKQSIVQYVVDIKTEEGNVVSGMEKQGIETTYVQMIRSFVNDGVFIEPLGKIDKKYQNVPNIKELVWCNNSGSAELTLGVIYHPKYESLAKDMRSVAEEYFKTLEAADKRLTVRTINETEAVVYDSSTETIQKNATTNLVTYRKAYQNAYATFTASQQSYFRAQTGYLEDEEAGPKPVKFSMKFLILGVILGGALGLGIVLLLLYISIKDQTVSDYSENLGIRNLGLVPVIDKKFRPWRNFLTMKELKPSLMGDTEESAEFIAVRLEAYCKEQESDSIAILSSTCSDNVKKVAEELTSALKKKKIKAVLLENVVKDKKDFEQMLSFRQCILIEELYKGNRRVAAETVEFCRESSVTVIGALGAVSVNG